MRNGKLTISDDPMFGRIMSDRTVCKEVIEAILGISVSHVTYHNVEQCLDPRMGSKGVRLDAYLKDEDRVYDVEMQSYAQLSIDKRFRYYQSPIDGTLLAKGADYDLLPESFIIFICTNDPYDKALPVYHIERICTEDPKTPTACAAHWIALNASAWESAVGKDLKSLLKYVHDGTVGDSTLVRRIDDIVNQANHDREWVQKAMSVMTIEENAAMQVRIAERKFKKEGRAEGRAEGIAEGRAEGIVEGRMEGRAEGIAEGKIEGRAEEEARRSSLIAKLLSDDRLDDLKRSTENSDFLATLYEEYGL